jgi:hypothetical protein
VSAWVLDRHTPLRRLLATRSRAASNALVRFLCCGICLDGDEGATGMGVEAGDGSGGSLRLPLEDLLHSCSVATDLVKALLLCRLLQVGSPCLLHTTPLPPLPT